MGYLYNSKTLFYNIHRYRILAGQCRIILNYPSLIFLFINFFFFAENPVQRKTRFEVVPCKSNDAEEDDDDDEDIKDVRISAKLTSAAVDDPKPNFSLCCGDAGSVSTLPLLPKKTTLLHPDR